MGPRSERILALEAPGYPVKPMQESIAPADILRRRAQLPHEKQQLDQIQDALIDTTGRVLQDELVQQFGFDRMRWQLLVQHNALSAFYLGSTTETGKNISLDEAEGVVEIRTSVWGNYGENGRATTSPEVRIGGVAEDSSGQNRAIGLLYQEGKLSGIGISFSDTEILPPNQFPYDDDLRWEYERFTHAMPSNIGDMTFSHETPGHITAEMKRKTSDHNRLLDIGTNPQDRTPVLFHLYPNHGLWINTGLEYKWIEFDATKRTSRGNAIFKETHPFPEISRWSISIPRALEK
ncbi:MAG: hypothetical protein RLZZ455_84 [Candidatus Parcubacteria bacterium]|jgi:hypothetical protein